jgi:DnaJ-class molecular chaperone
MTYEDLKKSLEILDLPDRLTIGKIRRRYRELAKETHPDRGEGSDPESFRRVHAAYRVLMEYAEMYKIDCSEREFYEQNPEERLLKQFQEDPIWGKR